jgi:hypothetical protein
MSTSALAYVLILRGAAAENELLDLLPQDRRAGVEEALGKAKDMPAERVRVELRVLREDALKQQRKLVESRIGVSIDHISPKLAAWLARSF